MKRLLTIALAVLFVTSLSSVVLAERTALSIGGILEIKSIYMENIDIDLVTPSLGIAGNDNRVEMKINLDVDADMTDNVSGHIGLEIDFAWADNDPQGASPQAYTGSMFLGGANDRVALLVDEAYIKIDELLMEELSLTMGVMNVEYSLRDDGNAMFLSLPELGAFKATLDYDPLYVDILIGKLNEVRHGDDGLALANPMSDTDLYGLVVEYYLENESKIQVIFFSITDKEMDTSLSEYSAGVSYNVSDDLEIFVQLGGQGGEWGGASAQMMAYNLGGEYTFSNVNLTPYVGISYQSFGGDDDLGDLNWINLGDVDSLMVLEADLDLRDNNQGAVGKILTSNYTALRVVGGCQIDEKTALDVQVAFVSTASSDAPFGDIVNGQRPLTSTETNIGTEIDISVTHQLTDDLTVSFGIGYVASGDVIKFYGDDEALVVVAASAVLTF